MEISKNHDNKIELFVKAEDSLEGYSFDENDTAKIAFYDILTGDKLLEKDVSIDVANSKIDINLTKEESENFPVRVGELEDGKPFLQSMRANVDISGSNPFRIVINKVVVNDG